MVISRAEVGLRENRYDLNGVNLEISLLQLGISPFKSVIINDINGNGDFFLER